MNRILRRLIFLLLTFSLLGAFAVGAVCMGLKEKSGIAIAGKSTEGHILAEIIAQLLEHDLGMKVVRKYGLDGTQILFHALETKEIDLYVEYTGTAAATILKKRATFEELKETFLEKYNMVWLDPLGFQNRYGLMMDPEVAAKWGIETLSDLAAVSLQISFDQEFYGREEADILRKGYHIPFEGLKLMDHTLLYVALKRGGTDVINGYTTDGFCKGLKILDDDQNLLPSYEAVPLTREDVLDKHPALVATLRKLKGAISQKEMQSLNYLVEKKGKTVYDVAHHFLKRNHFI
ncbi:glycine betaine ABC transporter substrate-binding protein [Candidatus Neptunochlamydia vexilliferae]|uniref:Carnitine transport binding protein OpuCC n=1 Tax=Candidatus Neptunichlamydia vexilliferae TaxID=1651774 RepID=A0ABS0B155_9BACT|nr:glycine betaine ABC transporter substrate-binding protein [Candidatus Neptunochlamydia vexilliferae]MBF5060125.1 Carnitine transport binding protein OpuCC [Candidatus Neptunochlamydia vexilliferae]